MSASGRLLDTKIDIAVIDKILLNHDLLNELTNSTADLRSVSWCFPS